MGILLTDEEVWGIYQYQINKVLDGDMNAQGNLFCGKLIAKAQLEKVLKAGYVQLDEDQSLPATPIYDNSGNSIRLPNQWRQAQQDMLKENWKKIKV